MNFQNNFACLFFHFFFFYFKCQKWNIDNLKPETQLGSRALNLKIYERTFETKIEGLQNYLRLRQVFIQWYLQYLPSFGVQTLGSGFSRIRTMLLCWRVRRFVIITPTASLAVGSGNQETIVQAYRIVALIKRQNLLRVHHY